MKQPETAVQEETAPVKIVFFGDSITESGRNLLDPDDLGVGYVKIAAGKLRLLYPDTKFIFLNRGVGGERTAELKAPETFRENYAFLVERILETGAKLFLIQPYALKMGDKQRFRPFLARFNDIIREIAAEKNVPLVPVDEIFMGVTQDIDPAQFTTDGVHPTHRGCRYIADLLIKELKKCL